MFQKKKTSLINSLLFVFFLAATVLSQGPVSLYVLLISATLPPADAVTLVKPTIALVAPNDNFTDVPTSEQLIAVNVGAGLGASAARTSLNLSTAVPVCVSGTKSVNRPTV